MTISDKYCGIQVLPHIEILKYGYETPEYIYICIKIKHLNNLQVSPTHMNDCKDNGILSSLSCKMGEIPTLPAKKSVDVSLTNVSSFLMSQQSLYHEHFTRYEKQKTQIFDQ